MTIAISLEMTDHGGPSISKAENAEIIFCNACRFTHVLPIPNDDDLLEMYEKEFYQAKKPTYFARYEAEKEYWDLTFNDRLEEIERHVHLGRILDVGCGGGFFLMRAKNRGWETIGIEPSPQAAKYARDHGIEVIQNFFQRADTSAIGKFNAIYLRNFIEHSTSPDKVIRRCASLLDPNGIIVIESPNDYNPLQKSVQKALGKDEYWIAIPDHINYFNFESLDELLKRNGIRTVLRESTFPLELFLLMGEDYVRNDPVGRQIHSKRMSFELSINKAGYGELMKKMYRQFAQLGIGRQLIVYGKKDLNYNAP